MEKIIVPISSHMSALHLYVCILCSFSVVILIPFVSIQNCYILVYPAILLARDTKIFDGASHMENI